MLNLITDPVHQSDYYSEFLNHVNKYKNQSRKSVYVRYYNVDKTIQNNSDTKSTLAATDRYYQIYEYTPALELDQITDNFEDSDGKFIFQASGSISVYTIEYPSIHDLVVFAYPPYTSNHVFRVKSITASLREKDVGIQLYKLELEYAYNADYLESLKISAHNVYSQYDEKYIRMKAYLQLMKERDTIQKVLDSYSSNFHSFYEIYTDNIERVDTYNNYQLYTLTSSNKFQHYFNFKTPYGAIKYGGYASGVYLNLSTNVTSIVTPIQSVVQNVLDYQYNSTTALSDIVVLLNKFSG